MGGIDLAAVYNTRKCGFGKTRADIGGDIKHRDRGIKSALGSIGRVTTGIGCSLTSGGRYQRPREKGWILSEQCQIAKRKRYRERVKEQTSGSGQPQSTGLPSECYLLELGNLIS
jgi:hypothetical protein